MANLIFKANLNLQHDDEVSNDLLVNLKALKELCDQDMNSEDGMIDSLELATLNKDAALEISRLLLAMGHEVWVYTVGIELEEGDPI